MNNPKALSLVLVLVSSLFGSAPLFAQEGLVISEFMADNSKTIKDDFGTSSDWVEIYNGTGSKVNLDGYYLTDTLSNLKQWKFPATNMFNGQHLLVWASGRNIRTPGAPLHTNFKLSSTGEQLALVKPDGVTVVHSYSFGPQAPDRSYGLASSTLSTNFFMAQGATAHYYVPTNNALSNKWTLPSFDDSTWLTGPTGLGFDSDTNSLLAPFIGTDVGDLMARAATKRSSIYTRMVFNIDDLSKFANPSLFLRYDDGVVVYINGQEVLRRGLGASSTPSPTSTATSSRTNPVVIIPEENTSFVLSQNLVQGQNVLAIHTFNRSASDADLLIVPELASHQVQYDKSSELYFPNPSPGNNNGGGFDGVSGNVKFSANSTTYFNSFDLEITPEVPAPLGVIRYTINGTVPTTNSPLYTGPISITNSFRIRARLFEPGYLPGPVHTESYVRLAPAMTTVSSDRPLLLVHSYGVGAFDQTTKRVCTLFVFEPFQGRSSFTNAPTIAKQATFKIRGSSTAGNPKYNWAVEFVDEDENNVDLPLLGMPTASQWVFHAPYNFDPSMFHNPLASDMSNEIGRYASRYRFAELYLNESVSTNSKAILAPNNYFGFYNILEHIEIGPNRVNIDKLTAKDVNPPEVTGGYLLSVDRQVGTDPQFNAGGQTMNYLDPRYPEISLPERDAQEKYINKFFNDYAKALGGANFTNPVTGYTPYIDVGAAVDHHIIDVIGFNVDGLRLSGYFHKDRDLPGKPGQLVYGPVWDFDRAFGSTDGRDDNPLVWKSQSGDGGTDFFNYTWWDRMFKDPNFFQAWVDRYQELREGPYANVALFSLMDHLNDQVKESAPRDLAKWQNGKRGGSQASELAYFKNWLGRRLGFMDGNFLDKPSVNFPAGQLTTGTKVTLSGPAGATIYYTLNGVDPRALHGAIDPSAQVYSGPITITSETRLVARSRDLTHKNLTGAGNPPISVPWSGPRSVRYTIDAAAQDGDLIVSELNYNPANPSAEELVKVPTASSSDFEFIELKNISNHRVDFYGAQFTKGVRFNFKNASIYTLNPGEILLVVKNADAFAARYGTHSNVAGSFDGNLNDAGDTLRLEDTNGKKLLEFTYNDVWYPATDGFGFTLVRKDLTAKDGNKSAWGPSVANGGSPGVDEVSSSNIPQVIINEALASSSGNLKDSVELLNKSAVQADISGWYLTDDRTVPKKYKLPANSSIAPGGFLVVTEDQFNAASLGDNAFQLSSRGDEIWLFAADASGNLLGYSHGFVFGPSEVNVTFGRYLLSTGKEVFVAQSANSLNAANKGPKVGPIEIREIHYHPLDIYANGAFWNDDNNEFIELQNTSNQALALYDNNANAEWHVRGNADYNFPTNLVLAAQEVVVLVAFNPDTNPDQAAAFRTQFSVPTGVRLLGPLNGHLNNGAGQVKVLKPGSVDPDTGNVAYVVVDEVDYEDQAPWPAGADGAGGSLQKLAIGMYGNDPASWIVALPTAGNAAPAGAGPKITSNPVNQTLVAGTVATLTAQVTGGTPLLLQWRRDGQNVPGATNATLTLNPVALTDAGKYSLQAVDASGYAESTEAIIAVLQPATIIVQPESKSVNPGTNVTFTVRAIGTGPLRYQWLFNGKPLAGATSVSLSLLGVQLPNSGQYRVVVTDDIGSSTSDPASLNVLVRPTFAEQPGSVIALVGDTVQFEVNMDGLAPFGYKWRKFNGTSTSTNIPGATNRVFRLSNVQLTSSGLYSVAVTNLATKGNSTNSVLASLIVMNDADLDGMGDDWEVAYGLNPADASDANRDDDKDGRTNLEEFISGTDPKDASSVLQITSVAAKTNGTEVGFIVRTNRGYTLQFREAVNRGDWQNALQVPGRTNEQSLVLVDPLPISAERLYRVVAPQQYDLSEVLPPTILTSPASQVADEGEDATFEVQATGAADLAYQWLRDGQPIAQQVQSVLTLPQVKLSDEGSYSVELTDSNGKTTSGAASLTVLQKPVITQQPQDQNVLPGATITLTVQATGVSALSYQWLKDEQVIAGATGASYTKSGVTPADAGHYRVSVRMQTTHGVQKRNSAVATVRVGE